MIDQAGTQLSYERKLTYDPVLRLLHWLLAIGTTLLLCTAWGSGLFEKGAEEKLIWLFHIYCGYVVAGALAVRFLWLLVGPKHARLADLWHPQEWLSLLRRPKLAQNIRFGHNPLACMLYLIFFGALAVLSATGLGLAATEHTTGPFAPQLLDEVLLGERLLGLHKILAIGMSCFIVIHIVAMILHERLEKVPVSQAMLSGYQYRIKKQRSSS